MDINIISEQLLENLDMDKPLEKQEIMLDNKNIYLFEPIYESDYVVYLNNTRGYVVYRVIEWSKDSEGLVVDDLDLLFRQDVIYSDEEETIYEEPFIIQPQDIIKLQGNYLEYDEYLV